MLRRDDRLVRAAARADAGFRRRGGLPGRRGSGAGAARGAAGRDCGRRAGRAGNRGAVRVPCTDTGCGARDVGARRRGLRSVGVTAPACGLSPRVAATVAPAGVDPAWRAGHAGAGRTGRRAGGGPRQRRFAQLPPAADRELGAEPVGGVLPDEHPPPGRYLAGRGGQLVAATAVLTAPMVVLEATSTQTDLVVALWVACGASLAFGGGVAWLGLATGLTAVTKVNGVAVLAPFLLVWAAGQVRRWPVLLARCAALAAIAALLAGPFVLRAGQEWDNPGGDPNVETIALGRHDPAAITVNGARIAATVLSTTSGAVNARMVGAVDGLAGLLHIPAEDPRLVFGGVRFTSVALPFPDEDHAAYPIQALAVLLAVGYALLGRRRDGPVRRYAAAAAVSLVLTAALIAWQPWINRLILPTFMVGTPLVGWAAGRLLSRRVAAVLVAAVVVVAGVRGAYTVWAGQPRPLGTVNSVLAVSLEHDRYVRARDQEVPYQLAAQRVAATGARRVGLLQTSVGLEYAWWVELRRAGVRPTIVSLGSMLPKHPAPPIGTVDAAICTLAPADCARWAPARWTVVEYPGVSVLLSPDAARRG